MMLRPHLLQMESMSRSGWRSKALRVKPGIGGGWDIDVSHGSFNGLTIRRMELVCAANQQILGGRDSRLGTRHRRHPSATTQQRSCGAPTRLGHDPNQESTAVK